MCDKINSRRTKMKKEEVELIVEFKSIKSIVMCWLICNNT